MERISGGERAIVQQLYFRKYCFNKTQKTESELEGKG